MTVYAEQGGNAYAIFRRRFSFHGTGCKSVFPECDKEVVSFQDVLNAKVEQEVKFSKHANQRLENRNIELSEDQLERLNQGVGQARTKQIQESLVMMDNLAFIVNVKNNTVVTAMEQGESGQVFTNIDGAVIV